MNRYLFALSVLLLTYVAWAAPAPNPFVSGWGNPVNPDRDCKIRRDGGALTIEMPGTDHIYSPLVGRVNAPRILRDFEGDFEMQVRIRIDCRFSAQSRAKGQPSFVSAGFLLILPDNFFTNCIRLEYRISKEGNGVDGCVAQMNRDNKDGHLDWVWDKRRWDWPFKAKPDHVYLCLERQGDILSHTISPEGKSWATVGGGQFVGLPSKLKVGLAAYSTSSEPSKVRFDRLWLTRGKRNKR